MAIVILAGWLISTPLSLLVAPAFYLRLRRGNGPASTAEATATGPAFQPEIELRRK